MHQIIKPGFVREDERGIFREVLNEGPWEGVITGSMKPGAVMGNHYHKETTIFFYLFKGSVKIDTIHVESKQTCSFNLQANEGVILKPFESHAIRFLESSDFVMLKSIAYDPDSPDTYHFPVEEQPKP